MLLLYFDKDLLYLFCVYTSKLKYNCQTIINRLHRRTYPF